MDNQTTPANPASASNSAISFAFTDVPEASFISGADLVNPETQAQTGEALQQAYAEATQGVPESNILNDWPADEDGNLAISASFDYHILPRTTGTFAKGDDRPARHCVHLFATPSVDALRESAKGREFIQDSIISALVRRAAAVMGSYLKSGDYTLPASLTEWISGRESAGGSNNAARGSLKLFNLVRADVAKVIRDGLKAKVNAADLRGLLASQPALTDKFGLHDKPEIEAKVSAKLFEITRNHMLAKAVADNAAWAGQPPVDPETNEPKPDAAPWPVNQETGQPDAGSLALFLKPLATWEAERSEAVEEAPELDFSGLDNLG